MFARFHPAWITENGRSNRERARGGLADKAEFKRRETPGDICIGRSQERVQKVTLVSSICRSSAGHRVDEEDRQRVIFAQKQPTLPAWERKPRNSRQSRGALQENRDF